MPLKGVEYSSKEMPIKLDSYAYKAYTVRMSRKRIIVPGVPHHVTVKAVGGLKLFYDDHDRQLYLAIAIKYASACGVEFDAWVLLDTHGHFVVIPREVDSLSVFMFMVNHEYACIANKRHGRTGHQLFEQPFWSAPMDEPHYIAAVGYDDLNPVRAGIVSRPQEYGFSSALYHRGLAACDPLVDTPSRFGIAFEWDQLHATHRPEVPKLEEATRRGVPVGSRRFLSRISQITGLAPDRWVLAEPPLPQAAD
jgi:putative transposase